MRAVAHFLCLALFSVAVLAIRDAEESSEEFSRSRTARPDQTTGNTGFSFTIQHCLRAQGCDPLAKTNSGFVDRGSLKYMHSARHGDFLRTVTSKPVSAEDIEALKGLKDYAVRLVCDGDSKCASSSPIAFDTVPACWLRLSRLDDNFILNTQSDGQLLSFEYLPEGSPVCSSSESFDLSSGSKFKSSATIRTPKTFPVLVPVYDRQQESAEFDEKGNAKPKAAEEAGGILGFFKRYWYIIVPMLILQLVAGAQAPEEGQNQAQGGQGGQRAPAR